MAKAVLCDLAFLHHPTLVVCSLKRWQVAQVGGTTSQLYFFTLLDLILFEEAAKTFAD
ncbi:hypothetical protein N8645_00980 [bacterium]|nr:hypothetical protein [bacterium]